MHSSVHAVGRLVSRSSDASSLLVEVLVDESGEESIPGSVRTTIVPVIPRAGAARRHALEVRVGDVVSAAGRLQPVRAKHDPAIVTLVVLADYVTTVAKMSRTRAARAKQ